MQSKLEPLDDKVAILPDPAPKAIGRVLVPDSMADCRPRTGTVLAVGPGVWMLDDDGKQACRRPMTCKPGDRVAYSQYGTDGFEFEGEEILVIVEARVLAILPAESTDAAS